MAAGLIEPLKKSLAVVLHGVEGVDAWDERGCVDSVLEGVLVVFVC